MLAATAELVADRLEPLAVQRASMADEGGAVKPDLSVNARTEEIFGRPADLLRDA
jgi:hypothetical protein